MTMFSWVNVLKIIGSISNAENVMEDHFPPRYLVGRCIKLYVSNTTDNYKTNI